jgi:hypothetical protein
MRKNWEAVIGLSAYRCLDLGKFAVFCWHPLAFCVCFAP